MLTAILSSWLILCIIVAIVANSMGRSAGSYFFISLFFSPIIGFLVLIARGRPTEDEMLSSLPHVYYCEKCGNAFIASNDPSDVTERVMRFKLCPQCKIPAKETVILSDEWKRYTQERREELEEAFAAGEYLRDSNMSRSAFQIRNNSFDPAPSQSNADEIRKYKELLDSGAITQEEYETKKKQLLGL